MKQKAVFIDRDGTVNINTEYISDPKKYHIYPTVPEGIKKLKERGFLIIIVTNQSGIGRGYFTPEQLQNIHTLMCNQLEEKGACVDAIYFCPHHPDDDCDCRKPKPGLFQQAIQKHNIDPERSYVIGDRMIDVEPGHTLGFTTILIPENHDLVAQERAASPITPDYICTKFIDAAEWILSREQ